MDGAPPISSSRNERIRAVRALTTRQGRNKAGQFLLEGPKVIDEALAHRPDSIESVLRRVGEGPLDERAERTAEACRERKIPCIDVIASVFDGLAESGTPQPLLAVAHQAWADLAQVLGTRADGPRGVVACLGVQDPGNVGTILRTARFFGLGVVLVGGQDPWAPKVVRAAAGALLESPPASALAAADLLRAARAAGLEVLALDAHGGEDPLRIPLPPRTLLLLGAEGPGLAGAGLDPSVRRITIAAGQGGQGESLNVAVSFGIVAAAWAEERRS